MNLLDRYLPSSLIGSKSPKIIGENLQRNLRYLIAHRNFYSHYLPGKLFESVEEDLKNKKNENHINNKEGIQDNFLFLLSLFLTKKETTEVLNCIEGKKSTRYPAHCWVRECLFSIKC